jgi:hypothetical protein
LFILSLLGGLFPTALRRQHLSAGVPLTGHTRLTNQTLPHWRALRLPAALRRSPAGLICQRGPTRGHQQRKKRSGVNGRPAGAKGGPEIVVIARCEEGLPVGRHALEVRRAHAGARGNQGRAKVQAGQGGEPTDCTQRIFRGKVQGRVAQVVSAAGKWEAVGAWVARKGQRAGGEARK